eukprot:TRINITY_DN6370_c0_g2_i4.p1 TRINITY_DN6370_c0_g2~~TRINITY_DN6370_c0_g2_i4.p1  ORF type:complete len:324 (-),score=74.95 TRINITY_DN6370_c0_g2_i4:154-1125(-)
MEAPASVFPLAHLRHFVLNEVLSSNKDKKRCALLGRFEGAEGDAIVVLEQNHINMDALPAFLPQFELVHDRTNHIYSYYVGKNEPGQFRVDVIHPATPQHIARHRQYPSFTVRETPEMYYNILAPRLSQPPFFKHQWVYNILEGTSEQDLVLVRDEDPNTGFVMITNPDWKDGNLNSLRCLALSLARDLRSVRDLTAAHVPLLRNIQQKGLQTIQQKYDVTAASVRVYVHYPPSYYHLHVHFAHTSVIDESVVAGRAILLDDVIDMLEIDSGMFQKRQLSMTLPEGHPIYRLYQEHAPQALCPISQPHADQASNQPDLMASSS